MNTVNEGNDMQKYVLAMCLGVMANSVNAAPDSRPPSFMEEREQSFMEVKNYCDLFKDAISKLRCTHYRDGLRPKLQALLEMDDKVTRGVALDHSNREKLDHLVEIIFYNTHARNVKIFIDSLIDRGYPVTHDSIKDWGDDLEYDERFCNTKIRQFRAIDDSARSDWFQEKFLTVGTTIVSSVPVNEIRW